MAEPHLTTEQVIVEVRRRYLICNRLFTVGSLIWLIGMVAHLRTNQGIWLILAYCGLAVFVAAAGLTVAIYRCPVCNKYLSRFRPDKRLCPRCGAQVREASGRP